MNTKLITLVMAAIATVVSGVTAYATYSEPPAWIGGLGAVVVEDEIPAESEPLELDNSAVSPVDVNSSEEGSEAPEIAVPDGSMLLTTGTGELPTVNVSDESIKALANAVAESNAPATVTNKEGVTYDVPSLVMQEWPLYTYKAMLVSGNQTIWYLFNGVGLAESGKTLVPISDLHRFFFPGINEHLDSSSWATVGFTVWSNCTAYDVDGNVVYEADVYSNEPVFNVDFVSGFDDLIIPSQTTDDLQLPSLSRDGFAFVGWYLDSDCTQPFPPDFEFYEDITLYAKWEELGPMSYFWQVIFASLIALLNCEPIFYLLTLICLCMILAVIRLFINSR